jgi:hypothetical protein
MRGTSKMKTAVIWNEIEELKYAVIGGDLSKFQGVYCNSSQPEDFDESNGLYDDLSEELAEVSENFEFVTIDKFASVIREGADCKVIECGFLP